MVYLILGTVYLTSVLTVVGCSLTEELGEEQCLHFVLLINHLLVLRDQMRSALTVRSSHAFARCDATSGVDAILKSAERALIELLFPSSRNSPFPSGVSYS